MLLLDKHGFIIGFNGKPETKPAPFPIDGTRWNGKNWEYPPMDENLVAEMEVPPLFSKERLKSFTLLAKIQEIVSPQCGKQTKKKFDKISVLIPSYKKEKWVSQSIQSALVQTLSPFKVIVLAMTDSDYFAASAVESPLVEVVKSERLNASAARNRLVELCPTEYFVLLDADDLLSDNFLETVFKAKASVVGVPVKEGVPLVSSRYWAACANLTVLLHKEVWNEVGGLREDLSDGGEDCYFLNEVFRQKKWLVDFSLSAWYDYRRVDADSLVNKNGSIPYLLSVEKEIFLHKDWYQKLLSETCSHERFSVSAALDDFLEKYGVGNESGVPVEVEFRELDSDNAERIAFAERWNKARRLFEESRTRDTDCVCQDLSRPFLFGRRFDLFVFARPSLDWVGMKNVAGMDENSCYVNNPEVDLSLPTEELLKRFCVCFAEQNPIAPSLETTEGLEKRISELRNAAKEIKQGAPSDERENIYTLAFFSNCDKNCFYCLQKTLETNIGEDSLYENFLIAMDKLESLHGKCWRVQLSGGELTLCSDAFARKIMNRLDGYRVQLLTNGNKYLKSPFYDYPNLSAYVHLTEPPFDDSFLRDYDTACVVANKRDLPEIINSVKAGRLRRTCHIPSYSGADKGLSLSDVDLAELNAALAERGIVRPSPKKGNLADCMRKTYIFRQVNLWNMTVYPCCGFSEPPIPLSEWNLQNPSGKVCENCPKLSYD